MTHIKLIIKAIKTVNILHDEKRKGIHKKKEVPNWNSKYEKYLKWENQPNNKQKNTG